MQRILATACLTLPCLLIAASALAEQAWVRDEIRLNIRTGASTQNRIVGVAKTGDEVKILGRAEGWIKVLLVAEDLEGWIPDGYLQAEPPPGVRLVSLEAEAVTRARELKSLKEEALKLRRDNEILASQDGEQQAQIKTLSMQNMQLRAGARYPEWITGACIFAAGMVLGAWLHRNASRRQPTRIRL